MQIATTKPCLQASQESDSDSVGSDSKSDHDDTDIEDESYCDGCNNIDLPSLEVLLVKAVVYSKCKQGEIRVREAKNARHSLVSNLQVCYLHYASRQRVPYPKVESSV